MKGENLCKTAAESRGSESLLFAEGHTVGALVLGGVPLVGAHQDLIQGAVVGVLGVMGAGLDGTLDALVGIHKNDLLWFWVLWQYNRN